MTLFAVAALHVALIALIVMMTAMSRISDPSLQPIQLVNVPAVPPPPVRADSGRPLRLRADIALIPLAPVIASAASAPPASNSSGAGRRGAGVDWAAEAHRAVKAYEIRRDQPSENSLSGKSPANDWWPRQGPHAGDEYKNDAGDWIVWINAECYKVAGWHSVDPASNLSTAQIVCPKKSPSPAKSDVSPASP